jgi:NitT/TauT family transport system substrate-binding protein
MTAARHATTTRRQFLSTAIAVGTGSLLGLPRTTRTAPAPEVTTIRLLRTPSACFAPQYVAEELLRAEGFVHVEYVPPGDKSGGDLLATGSVDITMYDIPSLLPVLDAGKPVVLLAGVHAGCYELFGNDSVRAVRDLKGKRIATVGYGDSDHVLLSSMLAYVGIDPRHDVKWVVNPDSGVELFVDGKADAVLAFAPGPQELRNKGIGHVIVNTAEDRPWSQYFCCAVAANRDFVRLNPIATKRAIRAILKAADICARDPERAANHMASMGFNDALTLQVLRELPYRRWRDAHPEDTLRFHALRLYEVGMIKSTPQKLIEQGTDWRFLNELRRELKA